MIYSMSASFERKRPRIDFEASDRSGGVDWDLVNQVLEGELPIDRLTEIRLVTDSLRADTWHFYLAPGTLGLISSTALREIGKVAARHFDLLPAWVEDREFFLLRCREPLRCFDRARSKFETFPDGSGMIMVIHEHAFLEVKIEDPLVFSMPEDPAGLYCTSSVRDAVLGAGFRGFRFDALTD